MDAAISLHTICHAVEVQRNLTKPSDGATDGQSASNESTDLLSTQSIGSLLASLHHSSLVQQSNPWELSKDTRLTLAKLRRRRVQVPVPKS